MKKRDPISVVILTKNEEKNIRDCIGSILGWADEIVVIDDESTDSTVEVAKNLGAKILVRKMENEGRQRNWAIKSSNYNWVFSLDADERFTEELKKEIDKVLVDDCIYDAFTIPRRNFIGNYWIRWGGFYPSAQLKLFRKDKFRWEEAEVHPRAFLDGKCGHLKKDLLHYSYRDWANFIDKLNKQTTLEAKKWYNYSLNSPKKARYKMNLIHLFWRILDRFIRVFIIKKGYKDGFIGFMLAYFSSLYQIISYVKYTELKNKK